MSSPKNKTLRLSPEEQKKYFSLCCDFATEGICDIHNSIICGDSFEIMSQLPREFADLIICDPPYNLTKNYNGEIFSQRHEEEYGEYTRLWLDAAAPLLKKTGSIYVCCDWRSSLVIGGLLSEYFTVRNRITWQREKGRGAQKNWKNSMEDIWFATASEDYTFDLDAVKLRRRVIAPYRSNGEPKDWTQTESGKYRDTCPSNFWDDITVPFWSMAENTEHPAQKPEKLAAKLILASSKPGDMVFDPFSGSGSFAVTAKKLSREYCAAEQSPLYCALTQKRLEAAQTDNTIQGYSNGVFRERNSL